MITTQELKGHWNEVSGRLKERWGQLTDSDLNRAEGSVEQLVGVVQQKTGASRQEIEDCVEGILADGANTIDRVTQMAAEYTDQVSAAASEAYCNATDNLRAGYEQAGETVRQKPVESLATAFGVGLISGVVISLMMRSR